MVLPLGMNYHWAMLATTMMSEILLFAACDTCREYEIAW